MSLFEVKGWDVPPQTTAIVSSSHTSRKRKRPVNDADRVQSAQVNVEKLMRKVGKEGLEPGKDTKRKQKIKAQKGKGNLADGVPHDEGTRSKPRDGKGKGEMHGRDGGDSARRSRNTGDIPSHPSKRARKKGPQEDPPALSKTSAEPGPAAPTHKKKASQSKTPVGLTSLQSSMKESLDGARFRWINEVLYTTGSEEGHKMMRDDPKLYEEYHTGFRQQVRSWPSNPISHYISVLSTYPKGTVVADLGCGDAALARSLVTKGFCILSFDLVADGAFVLEADICERIPLPGAEDGSTDDNTSQVVDVCVCALSLMSLDWIHCIRETWRILRFGGELKIAEVTSRFTDVDEFVSVITDLGFKLKAKDVSNTHFTLFDFQKVARQPISDKKWEALQRKHEVLKPCEYKRR